ncbi:MAG TPA: YihY/virulence factor BrkB family protein [Acidimicrobiales bacterium]
MTTPEREGRRWSVGALFRDIAARNKIHRLNDAAAGLSFWAILSLFPTLLVFASVIGRLEWFVGQDAADSLRQTISDFLNRTLPPGSEITTTINNILNQSRAGLAIVGFLSAIWGVSKGFAGLLRALAMVEGQPEGGAGVGLKGRLLGLILGLATVVLTAIVLLQIVVGPFLGFEKDLPTGGNALLRVWEIARWPVIAVVLVLWLTTLYHVGAGSGRRLSWRHRLPGAIFTMVAWVVVTFGFRLYVELVGGANPILGVLGAAIVSLTWLYLLCMSTLFGAELNAVLADRRAPLDQPAPAPAAPGEPVPDAVGAGVVAAAFLLGRRSPPPK